MIRLVLALLLLSGCQRCATPDVLVAVVEEAGSIHLKTQSPNSGWRTTRILPAGARSVQVSSDGRNVAWIEDVTSHGRTVMYGWTWPASADEPTRLGELGLQKVDAAGLAVDDAGRTLWVDRQGALQVWPDAEALGRGWSPKTDAGAWAWIDGESRCTRSRGVVLATPLCDPVALVLAIGGNRLVAATTTRLVRLDATSSIDWPVGEAQAAALSAGGRIAVVHRARRGGVPVDALSVVTPQGLQPLLQHALIISVDWASEDGLLVVRKEARKDIYELMLAHAPAEFGGEAASGTAVIATLDGRESPVEGLPAGGVRRVLRVR